MKRTQAEIREGENLVATSIQENPQYVSNPRIIIEDQRARSLTCSFIVRIRVVDLYCQQLLYREDIRADVSNGDDCLATLLQGEIWVGNDQ